MKNKAFPSFKLKDQSEKLWTQNDLKDVWTILYAYPKDMTSGCTIEAHEFTNALPSLKKMGAQVIGISPDDIKSHNKFCDKDGITFPLLSDPDKELLEKLKAWREKTMYGKKYMGVERSTWIINHKGKIVVEWKKVKVSGHVAEVMKTLQEMQQQS